MGPVGRRLVLAILAGLMLAGCGEDRVQNHVCAQVILAVESRFGPVQILSVTASTAVEHAVAVRYRLPAHRAALDLAARCRFAGSDLDTGRLVLTGVETQTQGPLPDARLHMVRVWLGLFADRVAAALPPQPPLVSGGPTWALYLGQQLLNGVVPGILYALIAVATTLAWGLFERLALIFGQLAMVGAYAGVLLITASLSIGVYSLLVTVASALWLAMVVGALYGRVTERLVIRPTLARDGQATLIASVGLALALQEFARLTQGSGEVWLQPLYASPHPLIGNGTFTLGVSTAQVFVIGTFLLLMAGVSAFLRHTDQGRAYRATCDDPGLARLTGVPTHRVANATFLLSGALCAAAGFIVALYYGGVGPYMGVILGFKGLAAAVLGGAGSVPGAVIAGLGLGLFEGAWDAYLPLAWRNVAVFGLLAVVLMIRPAGLRGAFRPVRT